MSFLNDLRSYSRRWVKAFIETYKNEASLWQMSHQDYTNNNVRNLAYDKLVEKLKEVEQNPDRNMVVKKINSLRSAFRREYRKKINDANYEPRLWYYDIMLFIANQKTTSRKSTNGRKKFSAVDKNKVKTIRRKKFTKTYKINQDTLSIEPEDDSEIDENIEYIEEPEEEIMVNNTDLSETEVNSSNVKEEATSNSIPVQILQVTNIEPIMEPQTNQHKTNEINHTIEHAYSSHHQQEQHQSDQHQQGPVIQSIQLSKEQLHAFLNSGPPIASTPISTSIQQILDDSSTMTNKMNNNSSNNNRHRHDDEFDAIGYNVASKLRVMNPTQRIIAEKLISDILFNGQLDSLTILSKIIS